jgi:tetratricopeptide (TPR) repeat protein
MILSLLSLFAIAFSFFQSFVVVGSIRDSAGHSVGGVRVSVVDFNFQTPRTVLVDSSGQFTIRGLPSGSYTLQVETTGTQFEEQSQRLELQTVRARRSGFETVQIIITLKRKKGSEGTSSNKLIFAQETPALARQEYKLARNHLKTGKPDEAIEALKRAIDLFPTYFDALDLLGAEYIKRNQIELALPVLNRALEVNRRAPTTLYALGVAYLKLNQPTEALSHLERSAVLAPNNPNTPMMMGLAYRSMTDYKSAEMAFQKAIRLCDPAITEAHFYLADIHEKQGRFADAIRALELFLKEAKNIDRAKIRGMIDKLKEKAKM